MRQILLVLFLLSSLLVLAQDETIKKIQSETGRTIKKDPADTFARTWKTGGLYGLNISQGSLSNWAAGGEDFTLAVNSLLSLYAYYKKDRYSWDNSFDFNLGYVKTTSLGGRKNDDRFDLLSKAGYLLNPKLGLAGLINIRSQFFKGYSFDDDQKIMTSNFFSPGYLLLSLGLDYKPVPELSIFLSPSSARWVIVRDTALSNKGMYGVEPGEKSNFEFGAFATINFLKSISPNMAYKARLDLFSNYLNNPQNIDLFMSNILSIKLSRILSATWGVDLIYDDDVKLFGENRSSPALQVKSLVGIGLSLSVDNR
jgi:hypothetical protein